MLFGTASYKQRQSTEGHLSLLAARHAGEPGEEERKKERQGMVLELRRRRYLLAHDAPVAYRAPLERVCEKKREEQRV